MDLLPAKRALLGIALRRQAPNSIPRSGKEGQAANCYVVRVLRQTGEPVIVKGAAGDTLDCIEFDGQRYSIESKIDLASIRGEQLEVTHYHGLATTTYTGWLDFALGSVFRVPYLRAWLYFRREELSQLVFNRTKLVTKQRIDLLKTVLDAQLNGVSHVSSLSVMTQLHTDRWYLHPNGNESHHRATLYLDALAETNHLKKSGTDYTITGEGIAAIERYEEEERKHSESIAGQRRMFWLTIVIAALTLVQAGLVRLPALLDLTK